MLRAFTLSHSYVAGGRQLISEPSFLSPPKNIPILDPPYHSRTPLPLSDSESNCVRINKTKGETKRNWVELDPPYHFATPPTTFHFRPASGAVGWQIPKVDPSCHFDPPLPTRCELQYVNGIVVS